MSFHARALETRAEPVAEPAPDDPVALATRGVEEIRAAVAETRTALEARQAEDTRALTARLEAVEVRAQRPGTNAAGQPTVEQRGFGGYLRRGRDGLPVEETRALRVADDTAAGYLAPEQFSAEIIRNLVLFSPVRQAARVGTMTSSNIRIPRRVSNLAAQWVAEIEERPPTQPTYAMLNIEAHEAACYVDVSNQLLEDSAFDIAGELSFDFGQEFARLEGQAFISGNGVKKPWGVLADPAVPVVQNRTPTTQTAIAAAGGLVSTDSLIGLMYGLPAFYRGRGTWMMNGNTIGQIRSLKDATGRYIWVEGLTAEAPPTLFGRPVVEAPDMPDVAVGATPILFGDIGSGFRIYDRVGLAVLRDPFTMAVFGQTRFHARRRVGAGVVLPEALRKLAI